ncbi:MAG: hypothetical protein ROO76_08635 [Terriglobia bacterium]|nr:hypothetical protein [Terriglobia bacterium]
MNKRNAPKWVVAGGAAGELGHCQNCGQGLNIGLSQTLTVAAAAIDTFCKDHARCTTKTYTEPVPATPEQWAAGRDTGISSMTIYSVVMGVPIDRADVPHDPADFGRCYRLLQLFPAWKKRLFQVAERYPVWAPMVVEWSALELLYEEALRTNSGEALYKRLQSLRNSAA